MDTTAKMIADEEMSPVYLLRAKTLLSLFCTAKFADRPAHRREKERNLRKSFAICFTQFPSRTVADISAGETNYFPHILLFLPQICNIQICSAIFRDIRLMGPKDCMRKDRCFQRFAYRRCTSAIFSSSRHSRPLLFLTFVFKKNKRS